MTSENYFGSLSMIFLNYMKKQKPIGAPPGKRKKECDLYTGRLVICCTPAQKKEFLRKVGEAGVNNLSQYARPKLGMVDSVPE